MHSSFDPNAVLPRSYLLPRGPRVRLRLPRVRDAEAIAELLRGQGWEPQDLEVARLVRADPRRRVVICATALVGSRETLLGIGALSLDRDGEIETLVVDSELTEGLDALLERAVRSRAGALERRHAA